MTVCLVQAPVLTGVETEPREKVAAKRTVTRQGSCPGSLAARSLLLLTWRLQWSGKELLSLRGSKKRGAQWTLTFQTLLPEAVLGDPGHTL